MTTSAKVFACITIATFAFFFVIETLLWNVPAVYHTLLPQLNPGLKFDEAEQSQILRSLFANQGIYNLMLAIIGVAGIVIATHGQVATGRALVSAISVFGIGASIALLLSTRAYLLGVVQLVTPVLTIVALTQKKRSVL